MVVLNLFTAKSKNATIALSLRSAITKVENSGISQCSQN